MRDGFVNTPAGRVHYLIGGSGAPLVLMHSNGCSAHEYAYNFDRLCQHFQVVAWDMPGHGDSDPLHGHTTVESYASAALAMLDQLFIDRAHVAGSSIGGLIAIELAAHHTDRLLSVGIVETPFRDEAWWASHWGMVEEMFSIPTQSFEATAPRFKALSAEFHRRWNIDRNKAGGKTMMDVMWAGREFDVGSALDQCQTPALLVFGDKGPVWDAVPEFQRRLHGAPLVTMPGCGHFPMVDEPGAFDRALIDFIAAL